MDGASNGMYYAAYMPHFDPMVLMFSYVFFEKKRIWEGKAKTALRLRQEAAFRGGRDLEQASRKHFWLGPGQNVHYDDLGRPVVSGR